ncbi:hypothetical protein BC936DRAFT_145450 [Jimgerdemannia flammicorona]|uniref:Uncharacterized protein n=1 Tax=Jimgerdemannia flammicorona TaxID=994334 RepID=A0A433DA11_9FUNG|nr:hypothetical protein BC936DRAFT_145450 [Jimgerdemannia flammicorona]
MTFRGSTLLRLLLALSLATLAAAVIGQGPDSGPLFTSFTLYEQRLLWTPIITDWSVLSANPDTTAGNITVSTGVLPVPGVVLQMAVWVRYTRRSQLFLFLPPHRKHPHRLDDPVRRNLSADDRADLPWRRLPPDGQVCVRAAGIPEHKFHSLHHLQQRYVDADVRWAEGRPGRWGIEHCVGCVCRRRHGADVTQSTGRREGRQVRSDSDQELRRGHIGAEHGSSDPGHQSDVQALDLRVVKRERDRSHCRVLLGGYFGGGT